jgi:hypothetical protein
MINPGVISGKSPWQLVEAAQFVVEMPTQHGVKMLGLAVASRPEWNSMDAPRAFW